MSGSEKTVTSRREARHWPPSGVPQPVAAQVATSARILLIRAGARATAEARGVRTKLLTFGAGGSSQPAPWRFVHRIAGHVKQLR